MQLNELDDAGPSECSLNDAALEAVLEHIPGAAVLCDDNGEVTRANTTAERLLGSDSSWRQRIRHAVRGTVREPTTAVSKLSVPGQPPSFLVVARATDDRVEGAVNAARVTWGLTTREGQVLEGVAAGLSNRDIASQLKLAPRTVELHVTSLLRKAGVESRSQLIIALWELSHSSA